MTRLVHGVGVNDADYPTVRTVIENGKHRIVWRCPIYQMWASMLSRCYSKSYQKRKPTYVGCSVDKSWHKFSAFQKWALKNNWEKGLALDKDILKGDNKVYGPKTCAFVDQKTNSFFSGWCNVDHTTGTCYISERDMWRASCSNPFERGKQYGIGNFESQAEAHAAWRERKHEFACQLAKLQTDKRVAKALRTRFK